ncbi:hypothetical protein APHAL10511_001620 [Amanita phalloides]|nr:hypothetical protein APHAL10511_001620 [Amanita phalloides]
MYLRSSAPNTPNKPKVVSVVPASTPTRKAPHCRKCKRPKVGHPRSGCPYVNNNNDPAPTREATAEPTNLIAHALSSLHITPSLDNDITDKENAEPRSLQHNNLRRTGARLSLSTTAGEVFERLRRSDQNQPPLPDAARRHSKTARIEAWQCSVAAAIASESDTDSSGQVSRESTQEVLSSNPSLKCSPPSIRRSCSLVPSRSGSASSRRLVRSMSMEEREAFLESLTRASGAIVYVVPKADIFDVRASAVKLGFRTRIVMNEEDKDDLQALLILARDEDVVEWLTGRIEKEDKEATMAMKCGFGLVAGGAVIGVVGTWAGLAFS